MNTVMEVWNWEDKCDGVEAHALHSSLGPPLPPPCPSFSHLPEAVPQKLVNSHQLRLLAAHHTQQVFHRAAQRTVRADVL